MNQKCFYKRTFCTLMILFTFSHLFAQNGTLKGKVIDVESRVPIPFANVVLQGDSIGGTTDLDGNYTITDIAPNIYNISISSIGFESQLLPEINVSNTKTTILDFELKATTVSLSSVEISVSRFEKSEESPLSKNVIRSAEIMRNPGGNRDISKVLQSFPGVASTPSFRNDIIVRGGAPNENRFYLDGIEVPNINHFATQGSSGGPVGMINVNFINEVEFYSGSFPASRGNALSSVLEFQQKNGNPDRIVTNIMLGSSDIGLTFDGPLSEKSDFIFSVRRSYLQLLFSALKLPFLPTYNDVQFKVNYKFNKNSSISIIGLGAIDEFKLNTSVNKGERDSAVIDRNNYILGNLPTNEQWNYTTGIKYFHLGKNSFQNFIISRNTLNNTAVKYQENDPTDLSNLILDYQSQETENKMRFENTIRKNNTKFDFGVNYEYASYSNKTFNKVFIPSGTTIVNYDSELGINKWGAFTQYSFSTLKNKLSISLGARFDANDYSKKMNNLLEQFSPRLSASYLLNEKWFLNFNTGRYFQLPAYTILGYRDSTGRLVNKNNQVTYIESDHIVMGLEHLPDQNTKIAVESFYKKYRQYPLLVNEQISLANLGSDFGVVGNAPVVSTSIGRSYGLELLIQRTILKGFYGIASYTFVRSEFKNGANSYAPSSWDSRHLVSITAGKQLKKNWELGWKFRFFGGTPYTPYDANSTALKDVWDISKQGVLDYSRINSKRLPASHQLDIRIDKKYYFNKKVLNIYFDIQNIYNRKTNLAPYLTAVLDENKQAIEDPSDASRYLLKEIKNESGTILPSVGILFEF